MAPTGGGKSLCYQLPAGLLGGTTLVVSPLIALMQDQMTALERAGLRATYLASTLSAQEVIRRSREIAAGRFDLVYVAPERLALPGFRALLADLSCPLIAVDEAHCISEWGHDFRPEYLALGELLATLRGARVLACTATATPIVRDELLARLGLPPETPQHVQGFARPELSLRAQEVSGRRVRDAAVDAALAEALGAPGAQRGSAIVYAPTRRGAEQEALRLAARGWRAECYHAGLAAARRDAAQRAFAEGGLEIVVATNAFGMGIDRADVRAVIHLGPPGSLEAYYQEVGRAGRDGARALGLLLHAATDFPLRRRLLESVDAELPPAPEVIEHKWGLFLELMRWADGGSCRHDAILRYFGDEAETLAGCGICDECARLATDEDPAEDPEQSALLVRKALSGVARVHGRFGARAALALLRGEPDPRLEQSGLDRVSTFGVLRDEAPEWLMRLLRRMVTAGWVSFRGAERPVVVLTESGARVMQGEQPARLALPPRRGRPLLPGRKPRAGRDAKAHAATPGDLDAEARALFSALRGWRLETARAAGVPPYVVASDRTLREVATRRPRRADELMLCFGIGPVKAEKFGAALLAVVADRAGGA